ncbi:hypothetical protein DUT91_21605 [Phyllobacterium salinisoli]|uniref:Uncharacterized protein n=2 Tax=Phyllobacterium salinisoli TaxID=1899321 RepID=A0A368JY08_9HYPH|nr:hypothetical protein DUT91_21605 [Phyllobacterium salinisoli]
MFGGEGGGSAASGGSGGGRAGGRGDGFGGGMSGGSSTAGGKTDRLSPRILAERYGVNQEQLVKAIEDAYHKANPGQRKSISSIVAETWNWTDAALNFIKGILDVDFHGQPNTMPAGKSRKWGGGGGDR